MLQEWTLLHDSEDLWPTLFYERVVPSFALLEVAAVRLMVVVEVQV